MWEWKSVQKQPHRKHTGDARHSSRPKMLVFMGDAEDRATVARFAGDHYWDATIHANLERGLLAPAKTDTALVLLDCDLARGDWRPFVREIARQRIPPCVVLASTISDDYLFEEIVKQGGFDLIVKPLHSDELQRIVRLALAFWKNRQSADVS